MAFNVTTPNGTDALNGVWIQTGTYNNGDGIWPRYTKTTGGPGVLYRPDSGWEFRDALEGDETWAQQGGSATTPIGLPFTGVNGHQSPTVTEIATPIPPLKVTAITSVGYILHEPSYWDASWEPNGLQMASAGSGFLSTWHPGFGTSFVTNTSGNTSDIQRRWRYTPNSGPEQNGTLTTFACAPSLAGAPTYNQTETTARIAIPATKPACVTALLVQLREPGGAWATVATNPTLGADYTLTGLEPITDYEARIRYEFPATAGGDGFSNGTPAQFTTEGEDTGEGGGGGDPDPDPGGGGEEPGDGSGEPVPLILTWQKPASGATISGIALLAFTSTRAITGAKIIIEVPDYTFEVPALFRAATGRYEALIDTRDYAGGAATLTARGVAGGVTASAMRSVTLVNDLASGVEWAMYSVENRHLGQQIERLNVGLKTLPLPASARRRYWTQARLLSDAVVAQAAVIEAGEMDEAERASALAGFWAQAQPVTLEAGKYTSPQGTRQASQLRYRSRVRLEKPGQAAWLMLKLTPVEALSWWDTLRERVVKIKRISDGVYWVLATSASGAGAIWEYKVTTPTTTATPPLPGVVSWSLVLNLDTTAPHAIDFDVADGKIYVVRDTVLNGGSELVHVYDRDSGEIMLRVGLPDTGWQPVVVQTVGEKPILLAINNTGQARGYDLSLGAPKYLWELVSAQPRFSTVLDGKLIFGSIKNLWRSDGGTSVPTFLAPATEDDIIAVSDTWLEDGTTGLTRDDEGHIYSYTLAGGLGPVVATQEGALGAVGAWAGALDRRRGVAGGEGTQLIEQGADGVWRLGSTLEAPEGQEVEHVTAMARFTREASPATTVAGVNVPAMLDERLLIGTGEDGLLAVLERSPINADSGAFLSYEHDEVYVVPIAAPVPAST